MTSKEALERIKKIEIVNAIDKWGCPEYINFEEAFDFETEEEVEDLLKIIEKDLEMLEIIKRNLYVENGSGKFKGIQIIQCSLGNQHSEDFNKVKEWLENDRK